MIAENVMGLDLSLTGTGIVVLKGNEVLAKMCIEVKMPGLLRMLHIADAVEMQCDMYSPVLIVIEGPSYASIGAAKHQIGELSGIVKSRMFERAKLEGGYKAVYPIQLVAPNTLKKFATGKGNAKKNMMLKAVFQKWGFDADDDNVADAYALARYGQVNG